MILSLAFTIVLQASGATKTENYDKSDWFIYCSFYCRRSLSQSSRPYSF
ncbi:MAG: hypothetical protein ACLR06_00315 [Christensenellaceae bacterium]